MGSMALVIEISFAFLSSPRVQACSNRLLINQRIKGLQVAVVTVWLGRLEVPFEKDCCVATTVAGTDQFKTPQDTQQIEVIIW